MPKDDELEAKLANVKHQNDSAGADEAIWEARSLANAAQYTAGENEFFAELDKQVNSL